MRPNAKTCPISVCFFKFFSLFHSLSLYVSLSLCYYFKRKKELWSRLNFHVRFSRVSPPVWFFSSGGKL